MDAWKAAPVKSGSLVLIHGQVLDVANNNNGRVYCAMLLDEQVKLAWVCCFHISAIAITFAIFAFDLSLWLVVSGGVAIEDEEEREAEKPEGWF